MLFLYLVFVVGLTFTTNTVTLTYEKFPGTVTTEDFIFNAAVGRAAWASSNSGPCVATDFLEGGSTCDTDTGPRRYLVSYPRNAQGNGGTGGTNNANDNVSGSRRLVLSNFGFQDVLFDGAIVSGITVKMIRQATNITPKPLTYISNNMHDIEVRLRKANNQLSSNKGILAPYSWNGQSYCPRPELDENRFCDHGFSDYAPSFATYIFGGSDDVWNGRGSTGNLREAGGWTGGQITRDELSDPNFSLLYTLSGDLPAGLNANIFGRYQRRISVDHVSLTAHISVTYEALSITPTSGPSENPGNVTIITSGVGNTGQLVCRFKFLSGEVVDYRATWTSTSNVTCPVPQNFGDPGFVNVDLSLDGGITFSNTPTNFTFTYLVPCASDCSAPLGTCSNVTGLCSCDSPGVWGSSCSFSCSQVQNIRSCRQCAVRNPEECPFCNENLKCGPCPGADRSINPFGSGSKVDFRKDSGQFSSCPLLVNLNSTQLLDPYDSNQLLSLSGFDFAPDLQLYCQFGNLPITNASFISRELLTCQIPPYVFSTNTTTKLEQGEEVSVEFRLMARSVEDGQLYNYGEQTFTFFYGKEEIKKGSVKNTELTVGEIAAFFAAGIALCALCCCCCFLAYGRHKKRQLDDKFRSLLAAPIFTYEAAFVYLYNLSSSAKNSFSQNAEAWFEFEKHITYQGFAFVDTLDSMLESSEEDLIRSCVYLFENEGRTRELIKHFIDKNVENAESHQTLFRGANFASKSWSTWCRMNRGLNYLHETLTGPLYEVCSTFGDLALELNPSLVEENQSTVINKYHLMSSCQKIFEGIIENSENLPPQMRIILRYVRTSVASRYPEHSLKIVGAFIFLRYYCPCIAAPMTYGLLAQEPDDSARRLLILVSKTLMNLANGVNFGIKEEYMRVLNDFISSNVSRCLDYYATLSRLSTRSDSDDSDAEDEPLHENQEFTLEELEPEELPPLVRETSLALLHSYLIEHGDKFIEELGPDQEGLINCIRELIQLHPNTLLSFEEDEIY